MSIASETDANIFASLDQEVATIMMDYDAVDFEARKVLARIENVIAMTPDDSPIFKELGTLKYCILDRMQK